MARDTSVDSGVMLTVAATKELLVAAWICCPLPRHTLRLLIALPPFVAPVLISATSGASVALDNLKLPVAEGVVEGSVGSQAPVPLRAKDTLGPPSPEAAVLRGEAAAAVSANPGGVKLAPPTTPCT